MLSVRDLVKTYDLRAGAGRVTALDGVSFELAAGSTLGILGESGCGKSTLAKVLVQLEQATSGTVTLDGVELTELRRADLRRMRSSIQLVFQDPHSSLNPRHKIGDILTAVLAVNHKGGNASGRRQRAGELLELVGLGTDHLDRLPHQLSGGQRQRVGIARALAVGPSVLILDEPVSALDVSVRAEIMNLLARLRTELGLSYIFISHDVAMVRHLADQVAVMYLGKIVEQGNWESVIDAPAHPYTKALAAAVPLPDPSDRGEIVATVIGEVPDPADPPAGCPFHPRCPLAENRCRDTVPELLPLTSAGQSDRPEPRLVACHVVNDRCQLPHDQLSAD